MELQAVVLADHDDSGGTRLYPLTEVTPKSLLSVANRPLVMYQLALLERSGFKEVIVATTPKAREELVNFMDQGYKGSIKVDIVEVDENFETADVLRALKEKISKDFVVISGDLVTDVYVHHLADVHRINDATCTVLLRPPKQEVKQPGSKPVKGEVGNVDFVALDAKRTRLLCLESAADVEDKLTLPRKVLRTYPNVSITNKILDAHFYIFSRWILDLLDEETEIRSIKTELVPYLIKNQFSSKSVPGQPALVSEEEEDEDEKADESLVDDSAERSKFVPIRCHALIYEGGYCSRADSLHTYKEMNFEVPRHQGHSVPWEPNSSFPDKVTNCQIADKYQMEAESQHKNETLLADE
eukprot:766196-Hanusia_phi.AAC.2